MKKILALLICLIVALLPKYSFAAISVSEAYQKLTSLGFENLKIKQQGNTTYIALEDNVYRGTYRGLGVALQNISPDNQQSADTIIMTALQNQMPRITLTAIHNTHNQWLVEAEYGAGKNAQKLNREKRRESSLGKVDFVIHPEIMIDSLFHDNNGMIALGVAPALEVSLWKGAKFTAQVIIPIWNNIDIADANDKIRPGIITLSQNVLSNQWADVTVTAGIFRVDASRFATNRQGFDLKAIGHINSRLDVGVEVGYTGASYLEDSKWKFDKWDKLNVLANISYYEPLINCQFNLRGGQFVYGDKGVRLDAVRRLAEYSVGCYATYADKEKGMGFTCSIPFGLKKKMKHNAVRISLPESIGWNYCLQNETKPFIKNSYGVIYSTTTDGQYSNNYWNPEYVAKYVQKFVNNQID